MDTKDPHRYDDMLFLPHPVSAAHAHMSPADRAAQFAPFAALHFHPEAAPEEQVAAFGREDDALPPLAEDSDEDDFYISISHPPAR